MYVNKPAEFRSCGDCPAHKQNDGNTLALIYIRITGNTHAEVRFQ